MDEFPQTLARARAGDQAAREALVRPLLSDLRAFLRLSLESRLRTRESASDLVQTVVRTALESLDQCRSGDEDTFRRWLFSIARTKTLDLRKWHYAARRDARREVPIDASDAPGPEEPGLLDSYATFCTPSRAAIAREEIDRVERAFDRLEPEFRQVLLLACVARLSHREIAEQLERSEEASRKLLSRARARLAMILGGLR